MKKILAALFAVTVLVGVTAAPAAAWQHNKGYTIDYYAPGPPPGGYLSACIVRTGLYDKVPLPSSLHWAQITGFNNIYSRCLWTSVQGVFVWGSSFANGPWVGACSANIQCNSVYSGYYAQNYSTFGAHYQAQNNIGGPIMAWSVSVF